MDAFTFLSRLTFRGVTTAWKSPFCFDSPVTTRTLIASITLDNAWAGLMSEFNYRNSRSIASKMYTDCEQRK